MTTKEYLLMVERRLRRKIDENGKINFADVETEITTAMSHVDSEPKPIKRFLFVEDGSVDTDELEEILSNKNPEIQLVIYRQGGGCPRLEDA